MQVLTPEERAAFLEAACAFLGQSERLGLYREQAIAAAGIKAGKITMHGGAEAEVIVGLTAKLCRVLMKLTERHPEIEAFRFRRHLFVLTQHEGKIIGMKVVFEPAIESIEG